MSDITLFVPSLGSSLILSPGANCAKLELERNHFIALAAAIKTDRKLYGEAARQIFLARNVELEGRIAELETALSQSDSALILEKTALGLGVLIAVVGLVAESPFLIGGVLAVEVLSGPIFMGLQVYASGEVDQSLAYAFFTDRLMLYAGLIGDAAGSTGGMILARMVSLSWLLCSARSLMIAGASNEVIVDTLKTAKDDLSDVKRTLEEYGDDNLRWGILLEKNAGAVAERLETIRAGSVNVNCNPNVEVKQFPAIGPGGPF